MAEDEERVTYFAETDARNKRVSFGIKAKDRSRHIYVIGKTGMGKSTLLENMMIQDIRNGEGFAFIDPHGASAEKLLDYVPEERLKDVIYFAPFDMEFPIAFNVMEDVGYDKRHLVVSGLLSAFKKIWVDAWSGRMEYILSNTLLALLEYPDSTLLGVNRMYVDKVYRKLVIDRVTDPIVKAFWTQEFATYTDRYTQEATPAIQNKIGQFTSNPLIRNIIGQAKSTFDLRKVMDERKIFIANLSKGRMGEINANLLGSMLTTKIYLSAMSRADERAAQLARLPNFYFYVDEFQSVANDSFADILSEARKYKLNLTIAHQYIEQMEENVRNAVFGNVGTTIAFRVGPFDAEVLETVFQPQFTAEDLVNLGFAQIYLTLMIDGVGSAPFSARTLPPFEPPKLSFRHQIIAWSRQRYGKPRTSIEKDIHMWNEPIPVPKESTERPRREVPRPGMGERRVGDHPHPQRQEDRREAPSRFAREKQQFQEAPSTRAKIPIGGERREPEQERHPQRERSHQQEPSQPPRQQRERTPSPPKQEGGGGQSQNRAELRQALSALLAKQGEKQNETASGISPVSQSVNSVEEEKKPRAPHEIPEEKLRKMLNVPEST